MTLEQFELCKDFHMGLIRANTDSTTITDARDYLLNGTLPSKSSYRKKAESFADQITARFHSLRAWANAVDSKCLIKIYNKNNSRNPSNEVFVATFAVIAGATINESAKKYGVNYQCIKVLQPRINRWDDYAKRLRKMIGE